MTALLPSAPIRYFQLTFPKWNGYWVRVPPFFAAIKPIGRAVAWFWHLTTDLSEIFSLGGGVNPNFDVIGTALHKPVEPLSFGFCPCCSHAATGGARSRWMATKMRLNKSPLTTTSASWKVMARAL